MTSAVILARSGSANESIYQKLSACTESGKLSAGDKNMADQGCKAFDIKYPRVNTAPVIQRTV